MGGIDRIMDQVAGQRRLLAESYDDGLCRGEILVGMLRFGEVMISARARKAGSIA